MSMPSSRVLGLTGAALMLLTITSPCTAGTENSKQSTWLAVDKTEIVFNQDNMHKGTIVNVDNKSSPSRTLGVEMPKGGLLFFQIRRKPEQTKIPYEDLGRFSIPSNSGVFIVLIPDSAQVNALNGKEIVIKVLEAGSVRETRRIPIKISPDQKSLGAATAGSWGEGKNKDMRVPLPADMIKASLEGRLEEVRDLLKRGADVNAKDLSGNTALMLAAKEGNLAVAQLLLDNGADVHAQNQSGMTALMCAAVKRRLEVAKLLLDKGSDVNFKGRMFGWQPLERAAAGGDPDVVKLLLDRGADITGKTGRSYSALERAAEFGHIEVVKLLLREGADVNGHTGFGRTALMRAAEKGRLEGAILLLDKGANVNARDLKGETALMFGAFGGHLKVVKLLLERGADVNARREDGWTASMRASERGHTEVAKLLANQGTESSIGLAATLGDVEMLRRLVKQGADINAKDSKGRTILMDVVDRRLLEAVQLLLENGADVNVQTERGLTALNIARSKLEKKIEEVLTRHGAMNEADQVIAKFGDNVARRGAELLLRLNDGTIVSRQNKPPIPPGPPGYFDAAYNDRVDYWLQDFLDPWFIVHERYHEEEGIQFINRETGVVLEGPRFAYFSPDKTRFLVTENLGECRAEIWKLSREALVRELLLDNNCVDSYRWIDPATIEVTSSDNLVTLMEHDGFSWRHLPSSEIAEPEKTGRMWQRETIRQFGPGWNEDIDINDLDYSYGLTALTKAASSNNVEEVEDLLADEPYADAKDDRGLTALMHAAARGHKKMVKLLLDKGADPNVQARYGHTPLMLGAGHLEVVELLLETKGVNVEEKNYRGATALMFAAAHGNLEGTKSLLDKGPNINARGDDGRTALASAAKRSQWAVVKMLIERGADIDVGTELPRKLLERAAIDGQLQILRLILDKGADVNEKDEYGRTVLMSAAVRGRSEMAKLLLERGADANAKDKEGRTALIDAAWGGNPNIVSLLLEKGTDVNVKTVRGDTALMMAAQSGNSKALKLLLAAGANVSAKTNYRGRTALDMAQERGHNEIEDLLHAHGAGIIEEKHESSDLIVAIRFGDLGEFKRLLDRGADVNAKDQFGNTAVMWAADRSRLEALRLLLDKGADINAKNKRGWTALMKTVWEGRVEAAKLLLDRGADINAREESGETALMDAARSGDADMVKLLLARGADTSAKNRDGLTAMKKARENDHMAIEGLLRIHGAKE